MAAREHDERLGLAWRQGIARVEPVEDGHFASVPELAEPLCMHPSERERLVPRPSAEPLDAPSHSADHAPRVLPPVALVQTSIQST